MANDGITIDISGLDQTMARLRSLPVKLQKKGIQSSLRKGANKVKRAIVANARALDDPDTDESIAKNIYVQTDNRHFKRTGNIKMRVGVLGGGKTKAQNSSYPGGDTWYWRLLEFGTVNMPAQPFIRPALQSTQGIITDTVAGSLSVYIDKELVKLGAQ